MLISERCPPTWVAADERMATARLVVQNDAPGHDIDLAEVTNHEIGLFHVAVNHTLLMCICHG